MGRYASLLGLLGLVFFGFGLAARLVLGLDDALILLHLVVGAGMLIAYFAFGFESFRSLLGQRSTRYGASAAVYTLLFVALVAGANYLGHRHHTRWDVTEGGVYTLAPQSRKVVEGLKEDLSMTAFVEGGISPGLESLLESYGYANPSHVKVRMVDPDKEPALVDQMKITTAPSVNLTLGNESFVVTQPSEETITNGLIRVARSTKKVVYFVEGFGQASTTAEDDPKGYSAAKLALQQENYEVKTLLLPSIEKVPDDASVVVMPGVGQPLTDTAVAALDGYLKQGGHLFALVAPREGTDKLTKLLDDWGAKLSNDIVLDQEVRLFEGPRVGMQPLAKEYGQHPITAGFRDYTVFPQTRTVDPDAAGKKGLSATTLVKTSASSWAETSVDDVFTKGVARLDESDKKGPLSIAVATTGKLKDMGLTPPAPAEGQKAAEEARLVVFGSVRFADNQELSQSRLNGDLFLNAVGWLVGQEELVSIRSRTVRASRAEFTPSQAGELFLLSVLIIPELLVALGISVWWRRRTV
jgi:gliding motility-associatede transport system auxiliary component